MTAITNDEVARPGEVYQRCGGAGDKRSDKSCGTHVSLVIGIPTMRGCERQMRRSEIPYPHIVGKGIPTMWGCGVAIYQR